MPGTTRELTNTSDFPRETSLAGTEVVPGVKADGSPIGIPVSALVQDGGVSAGHITDTNNPHSVTKAQVGLGNADNTSDADKPVSTAQQAALNAITAKTNFLTVTAATDLDSIRARVADLDASVVLRGGWDASAGTFPGGGSAQAGDSYQVTVAGTVGGVDFSVNDRIIALVDNASTTVFSPNWLKADYSDSVSPTDLATKVDWNRRFLFFRDRPFYDAISGVVRYGEFLVSIYGSGWVRVDPADYGLEYFELSAANTPAQFHYVDVSLAGVSNPVMSVSNANAPDLGPLIVPLGRSWQGEFHCFWTNENILSELPVALNSISLQHPIYVDKDDILGGGAAVYVPVDLAYKIRGSQGMNVKVATNTPSAELSTHVKFALEYSGGIIAPLRTISYDIESNELVQFTYPDYPVAEEQGFIPIISLWGTTWAATEGVHAERYDPVGRAALPDMEYALGALDGALLDPERDRTAGTSGAYGDTPLIDEETPVVEAVFLDDGLVFGVNPDTGETIIPYPMFATFFSHPMGADPISIEPLWESEDGNALAWLEYGPGRTLKALRAMLEFEDTMHPMVGAHEVIPVLIGADGTPVQYADQNGVWSPRSNTAPEAVIFPVNGVDQGFLAYDGEQMVQATFAQSDVTAFRIDRHNAVRFVEGTPDDASVKVGLAPFRRPPSTIANLGSTVSWHVPGMGQSLSVGYDSSGEIVTSHAAAPSKVRMFNGGILPIVLQGSSPTGGDKTDILDAGSVTSLIGAFESVNGTNNFETHLTSMGWALYGPGGLSGAINDVTVSGHGFGGTPYQDMKKGQQSYANMLIAVQAHKDICDAASLTAHVPWLDWVHGEANKNVTKSVYLGFLEELRDDMQTDIPVITGQSDAPFLVTNQIGSTSGGSVSEVALAALQFGINAVGAVCAGPKYMLDFSDGTHLESDNYPIMGEYHAKFALDYLSGRDARPMYLESVERVSGTALRLKFHVPVKPIQIAGLGVVTDPGQRGIHVFRDVLGTWVYTPVETVSVESEDTLLVTLDSDVSGANLRIDVAMQNLGTQGRTSGPRSQIHDSDVRIGPKTGTILTNWCCHSRVEVA